MSLGDRWEVVVVSSVSSVLACKGFEVFRVPSSTPIAAVAVEMRARGVGALVVVDESVPADPAVAVPVASVAGICSERDLVASFAAGAKPSTPVSEVMSSPVTFTAPTERLERLASEMTERRIRHLPVVDGDVVVGLVSIGDVVAHHLAELSATAEQLVTYVSTGRG